MKITLIADWLRYAGLSIGMSKKQPLLNAGLESILQQIKDSRDAAEIHKLANQYRNIAVEVYRGENQHMRQEKLIELTTCLQRHPIADELYKYKQSA